MHDSASSRNQRGFSKRDHERDSRNGEETWDNRGWRTHGSNFRIRQADNFGVYGWRDTGQSPERGKWETRREDPSNQDGRARGNRDSRPRSSNNPEEEGCT